MFQVIVAALVIFSKCSERVHPLNDRSHLTCKFLLSDNLCFGVLCCTFVDISGIEHFIAYAYNCVGLCAFVTPSLALTATYKPLLVLYVILQRTKFNKRRLR